MKIRKIIVYGSLVGSLFCNSHAEDSRAEDKLILPFLKQIVFDHDTFSQSAHGGYIIFGEMDLVGDERPEKLFQLTIYRDPSEYEIFTSDGNYLGTVPNGLSGAQGVLKSKSNGVTTIKRVVRAGNNPAGEHPAFTNWVETTKISLDGIETTSRIAGVGREIDDPEFNAIRFAPATTPPNLRYISWRSYLMGTGEWQEFNWDDFDIVDPYLIHKDDADEVRENKISDKPRDSHPDFTMERARELLEQRLQQNNGSKSNNQTSTPSVIKNEPPKIPILEKPVRKPLRFRWEFVGISLALITILIILFRRRK